MCKVIVVKASDSLLDIALTADYLSEAFGAAVLLVMDLD